MILYVASPFKIEIESENAVTKKCIEVVVGFIVYWSELHII